MSQTSSRLYYVYLLVLGFILLVAVLIFCYSAIFCFIIRSSREITRLTTTIDGRVHFSAMTVSFLERRRKMDLRTTLCLLSLTILCLTVWTPYAIVTFIGQFRLLDEDIQAQWPLISSIPAFFAKSAILFNPLVYGFWHLQFRSSARRILRDIGISTRDRTTMMPMARMPNPHRQSPPANPAAASSSFIGRRTISSVQPRQFSDSTVHLNLLANRSFVSGNHPQLRRGTTSSSNTGLVTVPQYCQYCQYWNSKLRADHKYLRS